MLHSTVRLDCVWPKVVRNDEWLRQSCEVQMTNLHMKPMKPFCPSCSSSLLFTRLSGTRNLNNCFFRLSSELDFHTHTVSISQIALTADWPPPGSIKITVFVENGKCCRIVVENAVGLYVNAAFNLSIGLGLAQSELKAA